MERQKVTVVGSSTNLMNRVEMMSLIKLWQGTEQALIDGQSSVIIA